MDNGEAFLLEEYKNAWQECRQSGDQRMKYLTYYTFFVTLTLTILYYLFFKSLICSKVALGMTILLLEIFLIYFGYHFRKLILKIYTNFNLYLNTANLIRYYFKVHYIKQDILLLQDDFKSYNLESASFLSVKLTCLLNSFLWIVPIFLFFMQIGLPCLRIFKLALLVFLFILVYLFQIEMCRDYLSNKEVDDMIKFVKRKDEIDKNLEKEYL